MLTNIDILKNVKTQYYFVIYINVENKKRTIDFIIIKNI